MASAKGLSIAACIKCHRSPQGIAGPEIYASDLANDRIIPYNYNYDPLAEYLNFISDGGFSVDGVLSEHPITASGAIGKLPSTCQRIN